MAPLDQLPVDVLHKVLCFVGDAKDLYSCEKTCRVFSAS